MAHNRHVHTKMGLVLALAALALALTTPAGGKASIHLDAGERKAPISRNLFGKFTEHLGHNVYLGMWAQLIPNPEWAGAHRWPKMDLLLERLTLFSREFGLEGVTAGIDSGIAAYWSPIGSVSCELGGAPDFETQRLSSGELGGGLETGIFPPFHRVSTMTLTLKARAVRPTGVQVSIRRIQGETIVQERLEIGTEWAEQQRDLTPLGPFSGTAGEACIFSLEFDPGASVELDRCLLFPADALEGWEPEVVERMKEAQLPMLRFPGGNFVSGYHWEDGVGPLDKRPTLPNPAWPEIEWNHVGTDEWLGLCELVGCEPLICLNAGNGTPEEARRWVEYCNGDTATPMGRMRARNGHPEPYNVRYWEIGNELYGHWQIGQTDASGYAERYRKFASAVEQADPNVLLIANGFSQDWNRTLVQESGVPVRSISVHSLPGGRIPNNADPDRVYREFMAYAEEYDESLEALAAPMADAGLQPRLAVTELQIFTRKPEIPNNSTLTEALWTAGIIHACIRTGLTELLTHSAMLNHGGGLRKSRGLIFTDPVWWTTHLYASQPGVIPTEARVDGPSFSTAGKWLTKRGKVPYLDVMGLLSPDEEQWVLFVVNRHPKKSLETKMTFEGFETAQRVQIETLGGPGYMSVNEADHPDTVRLSKSSETIRDNRLFHRFPPHSLTRLVLTRRK